MCNSLQVVRLGRSWITRSGDGGVFLVLDADKAGLLSLELTPEAMNLLRASLACAEPFVRKRSGLIGLVQNMFAVASRATEGASRLIA